MKQISVINVALVIGGRANWGRSRSFALACNRDPDVNFNLILLGSALKMEYGTTEHDVQADGFRKYIRVETCDVTDRHSDQARATAQGILELSDIFDTLNPDYVVTIADRFETMSTAIAASYANIPLVHVQGGEISGNIDDKVRWAITMLADIHFPSSDLASKRLEKVLKNRENIYQLGCPAIDTLFDLTDSDIKAIESELDLTEDVVVVCVHPNTEDLSDAFDVFENIKSLIIENPQKQFVIIKPNIDAGNSQIRQLLVRIASIDNVLVINGLSPVRYAALLTKAKILVGNSSSFIRESSTLGKPAIILGDRQRGRDLTENITMSGDPSKLRDIFYDIYGREFAPNNRYGDGKAGERILETLKSNYHRRVI